MFLWECVASLDRGGDRRLLCSVEIHVLPYFFVDSEYIFITVDLFWKISQQGLG